MSELDLEGYLAESLAAVASAERVAELDAIENQSKAKKADVDYQEKPPTQH